MEHISDTARLGSVFTIFLNSTTQERGIWSLYSFPKPLPGPKLGASITGTYYGDPLQKVPSWNWCIGPHDMSLRTFPDGKQTCYMEQQLNLALLTLFNNTFYDTGRISLAIETAITVWHSNAYYQNQPLFTEKSDAVIQQFVGGDAPQRWFGFGLVFGLTLIHLSLVFSVLFVYSRSQSFNKIWTLEDLPSHATYISLQALNNDEIFMDPFINPSRLTFR
jgi:hypothetical protein